MHHAASVRSVLGWSLSFLLLSATADAAPVFLDFDSAPSGSTANAVVPPGASLRFDLGAYLPELDAFGDPIPGSDAYRADPEPFDDVRVSNPALRGYGSAPSGTNALDALDQGVLITFDQVMDLSLFSVELDDSAFGFPGTFDIVFQDASGNVLYSLGTEQSVPGYVAAFPGVIANVASIYLPGGAYYDDLSFDARPVPGPSALVLTIVGLAGLASRRRPSCAPRF